MKRYHYYMGTIYWGTSIDTANSVCVNRPSLLVDVSDKDNVVILKWGEYDFLTELLDKALEKSEGTPIIKGWKVIEIDPEGETFTKQEIVQVLNFLIDRTGFITMLLKASEMCKDSLEFHTWCKDRGIFDDLGKDEQMREAN